MSRTATLVFASVAAMTATLLSCAQPKAAQAPRPITQPTPDAPVAASAPQSEPPVPSPAALVEGPLPGGPGGELARARCLMCHCEQYLVQQRLSAEGWKKTMAKMRKFGAPVSEEEATELASWLAKLYTPDLPMRSGSLVERPEAFSAPR